MTTTWEYTAVQVTRGRGGRGRRSAGVRAAVPCAAGDGWHLMTVSACPASYGGGTWAYYRRPAPPTSGARSAHRALAASAR